MNTFHEGDIVRCGKQHSYTGHRDMGGVAPPRPERRIMRADDTEYMVIHAAEGDAYIELYGFSTQFKAANFTRVRRGTTLNKASRPVLSSAEYEIGQRMERLYSRHMLAIGFCIGIIVGIPAGVAMVFHAMR